MRSNIGFGGNSDGDLDLGDTDIDVTFVGVAVEDTAGGDNKITISTTAHDVYDEADNDKVSDADTILGEPSIKITHANISHTKLERLIVAIQV